MEGQEVCKELVLTTPDTTLVRQRSKPTLVQIGNRLMSSDGHFHPWLATDYLQANARTQWVKVADIAKVFGGNTIDNKRRVRKNMFNVFTRLLSHGEFLVYETLSNGRINAVKLLDVRSEQERQAARPQLERMKARHQLTAAKYEKALQVIDLQEHLRKEGNAA